MVGRRTCSTIRVPFIHWTQPFSGNTSSMFEVNGDIRADLPDFHPVGHNVFPFCPKVGRRKPSRAPRDPIFCNHFAITYQELPQLPWSSAMRALCLIAFALYGGVESYGRQDTPMALDIAKTFTR